MSHEQGVEDLLLRARRNELDASDENRLEIALRSSRELELLYQAGLEFDASASLLAGDETRLNALVQGALERLASGSGAAESGPAQGPRPTSLRSAQRGVAARYFAAGLACSLLLSVALASAWDYVEKRRALAHTHEPLATLVERSASAPSQASSPLLRPLEAKPTLEPALVPAEPPVLVPHVAHASGVAQVRPPSEAASLDRWHEAPSEGQLFARANELRRHGDIAGAIALYQQLAELYPHSAEADDAKVLLGNLLLGQRSPQAALEQFSDYGSGALSLEALWGKARALRELDNPDERRVLERLVSEYPSSAYAGAARKRLRELSP
jgi:TolA-binding protein